MRADLVVLEGDPASDVRNFARAVHDSHGSRNIPCAIAEQQGSAKGLVGVLRMCCKSARGRLVG